MAALKPYSAPPTAYGRYTPFLILTARLLGERPSYYPVLSLAPSALATHVGLFSRLFGSPAVDVRAPGALPPRLRRLTYMAASRANGCAYCAANGCAFGDILRGPVAAQAQLYAGIPTTIAPLYAWVHARLGAASGRFLLRPADIEVARAFCFALRENVLIDDLPAAPRGAAAAAAAAAVAAATTPGGARRRPGGGAGGDGGVGAGGVGALRSPDASQWNVADRLRLVAAFAAATRSAGLAAGAHAAAARCELWWRWSLL
ncbi:hypothetical protein I4F81_012334 [Pyropia yezoensis]|uniref:Uncharacterized protein n=1 Tax=Pyropia yezoensis TaxID=2788 RepID=A0ACC3CHT4_PYRYE|nr:hypothetical protein I4F81_012334 [Neopyropia yezoensis]